MKNADLDQIRTLRGKLEIQGEKRLIHTVRNVGYVLREEA